MEIPIFPLGTVLFPGGRLPLRIFEPRYVEMTKACLRDSTPFGVCLIREGQEIGQPATPQSTGCLATIEQWDVPHPNLFTLIARGGERFRVLDTTVNSSGLIIGKIEMLPQATATAEMDAACEEVLRLAIKRAGADSVPGLTWPTMVVGGGDPVKGEVPGKLSINLGGVVVQVWHPGPGHTRGDTIAWVEEEKVLFSGDLVEYEAGVYTGLGAFSPYIGRFVDALGHSGYVLGAMLALWYGSRIVGPPAWIAPTFPVPSIS